MYFFLTFSPSVLEFFYRVNRMKIKLEPSQTHAVLNVTEQVGAEQASMLRLGIVKFFGSMPDKPIILNLLEATETESNQFATLISYFATTYYELIRGPMINLIIVSNNEAIAHMKTVSEAVSMLKNPLFKLMIQDMWVVSRIKALEARKPEIEKKLQELKATGQSLDKLRKENSDLRATVRLLETEIERYLKKRKDPVPQNADQLDSLEKTLTMILQQESLLEVT